MRRDYLTMLLFVTVLAAASWYRADALIFKVWLAPLVLFAVPIHALIELPEHFACNTDEKNVFENTRSIKSNAFMTWFTNGNNYHVEHHLMPGLPIDRLHDLHISIRGEIKHYHSTYKEFFAALVTNRLKHISSRSDGK